MPPAGEPLAAGKVALLRSWIEQGASLPPEVNYAKEVQPILQASCYPCHSGAQPKGQLRLDAKSLAMRGGLSGPVILPGDSANSRLVHRVLGMNGEQRMPLRGTPLTDAQTAVLRRWIDAGAPWPADGQLSEARIDTHWAYGKPLRTPLPAVSKGTWVRNPIDVFVLARLDKDGLAPSPEAARETLIRRVSLDLTGLPPTLQEIDAFTQDARPDAYERLVDRLLASPHYGERWARPWLDLARYADTNGYEKDRRRVMWKYRDWVIQALNRDLPFDRFTIEQLAGDLLPDATVDQKIATGFHRNTLFNEEGGVDKEEAHHEVLVDRVNTTATVWLGSTLACAQCHNHKFDPFTQKEYYQFLAFFNNSSVSEKEYGDTSRKWLEPQLDLPTPAQGQRRNALQQEIAALETTLKTHTPELAVEQNAWEDRQRQAQASWTTLGGTARSSVGTPLVRQADSSLLAGGTNPETDAYVIEAPLPAGTFTGLRVEALPDSTLPRGGPGRDTYGNFALTDLKAEIVPASGDPVPVRFRLAKADNGQVKDRAKPGPGPLWTVDASREDERVPRQLVLVPSAPLRAPNATLRVTLTHASEFSGQGLGRFRLSVTTLDSPERLVEVASATRPLLATPADARTADQKAKVEEAYRSVAPTLRPVRERLTEARKELDALGIESALIMGDRPATARLSAPLRVRGAFLSPGEPVFAGVPAILPALPRDATPNRLSLARWLVSRDHPLTARVRVNQIWEQYFGRGLVETSEDFGAQGEKPTHPELLDWLAVELMEQGWSQKALHRLIVTSATYRQSSRLTPALRERDPDNRLLARGPRFRMDAEMVRDVSLAASGLLSRKLGGPSVFPYQPEGVWDLPYNDDQWVESRGEDRHRRSLYTFLRRSAPHPSMVTFDAPSREFCTVRRIRTNTPLQALTGLNDPAFFEAARALARRVVEEAGPAPAARAERMFRLAAGRRPTAPEVTAIIAAYEREKSRLLRAPQDAAKLAGGSAEEAAWTLLANVILNLDETVTKE